MGGPLPPTALPQGAVNWDTDCRLHVLRNFGETGLRQVVAVGALDPRQPLHCPIIPLESVELALLDTSTLKSTELPHDSLSQLLNPRMKSVCASVANGCTIQEERTTSTTKGFRSAPP
jgi:hypothetical protein